MPEISGERPTPKALDYSELGVGKVVVAYDMSCFTRMVLTIRSVPRLEDGAESGGSHWVIDTQTGPGDVVARSLADLGVPHETGEWNPDRFTVAFRDDYPIRRRFDQKKQRSESGPRLA